MKLGALVDEIFRSIGGCHLRDIGLFMLLLRWSLACVNVNVVISAFSFFAPYMSDFKTNNAKRVAPPSVAPMSLATGVSAASPQTPARGRAAAAAEEGKERPRSSSRGGGARTPAAVSRTPRSAKK